MSSWFHAGLEFGKGVREGLLGCLPCPPHDPIVALHQGIPTFTFGGLPVSSPLNLPFDEIATVAVFATRQSGQKTNVPVGSTIASDNPAVAVALVTDTNGVITGYTATATALSGVANVTLAEADGSLPDVAVITIVDDAVASLGQDTANATFSPNPTPPTA